RRSLTLTRLPERRVAALTRLDSGLCIANLHASTSENDPAGDVLAAANAAIDFAGERPLLFGGDLNLRPASSGVFEELAELGFTEPASAESIDHLLARGGMAAAAPQPWPPQAREVESAGLAIRLSD